MFVIAIVVASYGTGTDINLGTDLPVKVDADLAIEDLTGAQGNVKFLLAPRIDRE